MKAWAAWLVLLLAACDKQLPKGVTELVYATPYAPSHPFSRADQTWIDFVEQRSGNTLHIVPSWSGALISSENSMIELRHGVADIGLITPIYVKGGTHLIRFQAGFYSGITTFAEQVKLYHCIADHSPQFNKELAGLKVLAVQGGSLPGIITTKKVIHSLDDLKGLRLRGPTELLGVLGKLGADPVNMPMGDVYSALAKGVLDGVVAPLDTFRSLHFAEVANHYADLKVPRGAYPARAMSTRRWLQLTEFQRQVLEEGITVWEHALDEQTSKALDEGDKVAHDAGVEFTDLLPGQQQRFDALYLEYAALNAAALADYGIDGNAVFAVTRASIGTDGNVSCSGGSP